MTKSRRRPYYIRKCHNHGEAKEMKDLLSKRRRQDKFCEDDDNNFKKIKYIDKWHYDICKYGYLPQDNKLYRK